MLHCRLTMIVVLVTVAALVLVRRTEAAGTATTAKGAATTAKPGAATTTPKVLVLFCTV